MSGHVRLKDRFLREMRNGETKGVWKLNAGSIPDKTNLLNLLN
jgi:hypothetical protein